MLYSVRAIDFDGNGRGVAGKFDRIRTGSERHRLAHHPEDGQSDQGKKHEYRDETFQHDKRELSLENAPPLDPVVASQYPGNGFGVKAVFFGENSCRQVVGRIAIKDRDGGLEQDGTAIEVFIHKMNCATGNLYAVRPGLELGIKTWKGRKKRGVDIQD